MSGVPRIARVSTIMIANAKRPAHGAGTGLQRQQHADEAGTDRGPTAEIDRLLQHNRGNDSDEDRRGKIVGNHVGERQVNRCQEEGRHLAR
jgi:sugar lactone lactonase YvrE